MTGGEMRLRRAVAPALVLLAAFAPGSALGQAEPPGRTRVGELREQVKRTTESIQAGRDELDAAVAGYENARARMGDAARRLREARERLDAVNASYAANRQLMRRRAVALYKGERLQMVDSLLGSRSLDSFIRRLAYLASVTDRDVRWVERLSGEQRSAAEARLAVRDEAAIMHAQLRAMADRSDVVMDRMRVLQRSLELVKTDLKAELSKWRFPVPAPYSFVDSFGAPRMVGTSYEHSHQGQDIFAPMGTPVTAVVSGVVENVGSAVLGGNKLWLRGDDGMRYYYAHLSAYAPAGKEGTRVDPGTALGYVGDTGNARGTPPHLHFEMHGPGGVINPYQTLRDAESGWASA